MAIDHQLKDGNDETHEFERYTSLRRELIYEKTACAAR
jgi:hypothetical protein